MKEYEKFKEGQEVFVLTDSGLSTGIYVRLETHWTARVRLSQSYSSINLSRIFSSTEAAKHYLITGEVENLPNVVVHESKYNVGDSYFYCDEKGLHEERVTNVEWRLGQWEYHCNCGGAAVYLDRENSRYHKTREEAVEAYLNQE